MSGNGKQSENNSRIDTFEIWKEINENARHWERVFFESVKNYFTVIALSIGAAGAAVTWSTVSLSQRVVVSIIFLTLALILSWTAYRTAGSQQRFIRRHYERRKQIEEEHLEKRNTALRLIMSDRELQDVDESRLIEQSKIELGANTRSRQTVRLIRIGFGAMFCLAGILVLLAGLGLAIDSQRPLLSGAKLVGADLSRVQNLSQHDLTDACGDETTRLPPGLIVPKC